MRREEEGNARDGDQRIDLESGVVVINSGNGAARTVSGHRRSGQTSAGDGDAELADSTETLPADQDAAEAGTSSAAKDETFSAARHETRVGVAPESAVSASSGASRRSESRAGAVSGRNGDRPVPGSNGRADAHGAPIKVGSQSADRSASRDTAGGAVNSRDSAAAGPAKPAPVGKLAAGSRRPLTKNRRAAG